MKSKLKTPFEDVLTFASGSEWVHEDSQVTVNPGDKVYYWVYVLKNGEGSTLTGQVWTAAGKCSVLKLAYSAIHHNHEWLGF